LLFIFRVRPHCNSVSCAPFACSLKFVRTQQKVFYTHSYISDDKEGRFWLRLYVGDSK
jgi:hypothetical protein